LENFLADSLGIQIDLVMQDALKPAISRQILQEVVPV
jgi:predicted nucleotidyltransferase